MMERLKDLVERLEKRYTKIPFVQWFIQQKEKKYGSPKIERIVDPIKAVLEEPPKKPEPVKEPERIVFRDDASYNEAALQRILEDFSDMGRELRKAYPEQRETEAYYKCVGQFGEKVSLLLEKRDMLAKGEKTAKRLNKVLRQTLLKVWDMGQCGPILERHIARWGIGTRSFAKGYRMSDDDLDYLDLDTLQAYQVNTDDREKEYQVIEMIHPVFSIWYVSEDEEEPEAVYIPGKCRYYCCRDGI